MSHTKYFTNSWTQVNVLRRTFLVFTTCQGIQPDQVKVSCPVKEMRGSINSVLFQVNFEPAN